MFFTKEDIEKIARGLSTLGVKDTQFDLTNTATKEDTIVLVQNNTNKRMFIKDFFNSLGISSTNDFINMTEMNSTTYSTIDEVIHAIPVVYREPGLCVTWQDTSYNWQIYQFRGEINQWDTLTMWINLYDFSPYVINSFLPDEEDITSTEADDKGNKHLKLSNREYNKKEFSGKGYSILRKNIQEIEGKDVNLLTQAMVSNKDTIYEIRYDFDLNGETVVIPENCILKFEGGKLSNGSIVGSNTYIHTNVIGIFNVVLKGTFSNSCFEIEWFCVVANDENKAFLNSDNINTYLLPSLSNIKNTLHTSVNKTYFYYSPMVLDGTFNFISEGRLIYTGKNIGAALTIGLDNDYTKSKEFKVYIEKQNNVAYSTPIDFNALPDSIGVSFINIRESKININCSKGFTYPVKLLAKNSKGFVNNIVTLGNLGYNYYVGLTLQSESNGWINENLFLGGHISQESTSAMLNYSTAILLDASATTNTTNNNTFIKQNIEGNNVGIRFNNAYNNTFYNIRTEKVTSAISIEDYISKNNTVLESGTASTTGKDYINYLNNNTVLNINDLTNVKLSKVFSEKIKVFIYNDGKYNYISSNLSVLAQSAKKISSFKYYMSTGATATNSQCVFGHVIDTSVNKTFLLESNIASRFCLFVLDENEQIIIIANSPYDYIKASSGWQITNSHIRTSADTEYKQVTFKDGVKKAFIGILGNSESLNTFSCYTYSDNKSSTNLQLSNSHHYAYNLPVSTLNVEDGDIIYINMLSKICVYKDNQFIDFYGGDGDSFNNTTIL